MPASLIFSANLWCAVEMLFKVQSVLQ